MKLYDVIRKEDIEKGTPLKEIPLSPNFNRPRPYRDKSNSPILWKRLVVVSGIFLFLIGVYIAGMKFVRATVIVTERKIPFTLDAVTFEAVPEKQASPDQLSFQTMVVPTTVSRQVFGSDVSPSTSAATGKAVFFNEYSKYAQTVKAKTLLTGSNGKTYRTTQNVTVPGYTIVDKEKKPGTSIATSIVATSVGPDYNTDGTSFTVSGWTGSRAKVFYAQSAGSITGGENGMTHSISATQKDDTVATLEADLTERLKRETRTQVPDTFLAFPDMQVTSIDTSSIVLSGPTVRFPASIAGTMVTYLLPREGLERAIADHVLSDHPYARVSIPAITSLTVTPLTPLPADTSSVPDMIQLHISGSATIIAKVSPDAVQQALLGAPKRSFAQLLSPLSEIDTAKYRFYPFWAPYFPRNASRITIKTN